MKKTKDSIKDGDGSKKDPDISYKVYLQVILLILLNKRNKKDQKLSNGKIVEEVINDGNLFQLDKEYGKLVQYMHQVCI